MTRLRRTSIGNEGVARAANAQSRRIHEMHRDQPIAAIGHLVEKRSPRVPRHDRIGAETARPLRPHQLHRVMDGIAHDQAALILPTKR